MQVAGLSACLVLFLTALLASCKVPTSSPSSQSSPNRVWKVSTMAGSGRAGHRDGTGTSARFHTPHGMAVDSSGNVYVADDDNHRIRKITAAGVVSTLAGSGTGGHRDGTGTSAQFNNPRGVAVDTSGNLYVADMGAQRILKIEYRVP